MNDPYNIPDQRPSDPEDIHIPVGEPDPDLYEMPSYELRPVNGTVNPLNPNFVYQDGWLRRRQAGGL